MGTGMISQTKKAYMAGFMDGEGTIGISVGKSTAGYPIPQLRVSFSNFNEQIIKDLQTNWNGSVSMQKSYVWVVTMNGEDADHILLDAVKYLVVKKKIARRGIQFYSIQFVSPDENHVAYVRKLEAALEVMYETRRGYKAIRGHKMIDKLKGAIEHVNSRTRVSRDSHI